ADKQLAENEWLAGDEYTIADMAAWPWFSRFEWHNVDFEGLPNFKRWYNAVASRPGVQRGYDVPKRDLEIPMIP
ncbi:MAG: glutathione binding-like protein, partial [Pseudomonadota bacterium]